MRNKKHEAAVVDKDMEVFAVGVLTVIAVSFGIILFNMLLDTYKIKKNYDHYQKLHIEQNLPLNVHEFNKNREIYRLKESPMTDEALEQSLRNMPDLVAYSVILPPLVLSVGFLIAYLILVKIR